MKKVLPLLLLALLLPTLLLASWPALPAAADGDPAVYVVNRNAQPDGDHEVHREGCRYFPQEANRVHLGEHPDCRSAVEAARRHYRTADGCYHCSRACDTG